MYDEESRNELAHGIYTPKDEEEQLNILERAYQLCLKNADLYEKIRVGMKKGKLKDDWPDKLIEHAFESGILTKEEFDELEKTEKVRAKAIEVDSFTLEELPVNLKAPQQTPDDAELK
jgi:acyl-CoA dehydrogenase